MKKQVYFPIRQPFNLYLDRYEDPKEVNKRYLQKRLGKTHPFEGPEQPLRFPMAHAITKRTPTWLRTEIKKERTNKGRMIDTFE
jgi:large subunit ribosomal protein L38